MPTAKNTLLLALIIGAGMIIVGSWPSTTTHQNEPVKISNVVVQATGLKTPQLVELRVKLQAYMDQNAGNIPGVWSISLGQGQNGGLMAQVQTDYCACGFVMPVSLRSEAVGIGQTLLENMRIQLRAASQ
jgi:hypothetical protein